MTAIQNDLNQWTFTLAKQEPSTNDVSHNQADVANVQTALKSRFV